MSHSQLSSAPHSPHLCTFQLVRADNTLFAGLVLGAHAALAVSTVLVSTLSCTLPDDAGATQPHEGGALCVLALLVTATAVAAEDVAGGTAAATASKVCLAFAAFR